MRALNVRRAVGCALLFAVVSGAHAATLTVTTLVDELQDRFDLANDCSLREAVISVNEGGNRFGCTATGTYGQNDTISLPEGTMNLVRTQGIPYKNGTNGNLDLNRDVIIEGRGADRTTISGASLPDRFNLFGGVFDIDCDTPSTVVLRDLTITGGSGEYGGAISSCGGDVTLDHVELTDNTSSVGGAFKGGGRLTIVGSTVSNSVSGGEGGAIWASDLELEILNSTFSGNRSADHGGGLYLIRTDAELSSVTMTDNQSTSGSGGGVYVDGPDSDVRVRNTLIAGNSANESSPDCRGSFDSFGFNLIGDATGCTGFDSSSDDTGSSSSPIDPLLGPLADNGGPTRTHMPAPDSPAVDEGGIPGITDPLRVDQRGVDRPMDGNGDGTNRYDIGAVERAGTANADVSIQVVDTQDPSPLGNVFFYEMTARNDGPAPATDVVASGFVTGGEIVNWTICNMDGPTSISCLLGELGVGEEVTRSFSVFPDPGSGEMTATVDVVSDLPDPLLANNSASEVTTIEEPSPILALDLSDSADPVLTGQDFTYRIAVSNVGNGVTGTITIQGSISGGAAVETTPAACSATSSTTFECSVGSRGPGEVAVLEVDVRAPDSPGFTELEVVASATIAGSVQDRTSTQVVAPVADLRMRKTGPSGVLVGTEFAYSLVVSHEGGNAPAENIVVTDTLPPEVTPLFAESGPISFDCGLVDLVLECSTDTLAPGEETVLLITVKAPASEVQFVNEATVASDTTDPNPDNDTDAVTTLAVLDFEPAADLGVLKSAPLQVEPGTTFTYQVSVFNNGPDLAEGVVVTDVLPPELELDFAPIDCDGTLTITCSFGNIDPGELATIEIEVVAPADFGLLTNVASVTSTSNDPDPDNDSASALTVVSPVQTGGSPTIVVQPGPAPPHDAEAAGTTAALQADLVNLSAEPVDLAALTLRAAGTGDDVSGIAAVRVYDDADADGEVDAGEDLLASGKFGQDEGKATLALQMDPMPSGSSMTALVVVDLTGQSAANLAPVAAVSLAALLLAVRWTRRRLSLTMLAIVLLVAGCARQPPPVGPVSYQLSLDELVAQGVETGLQAIVLGVPLEGAVLQVE